MTRVFRVNLFYPMVSKFTGLKLLLRILSIPHTIVNRITLRFHVTVYKFFRHINFYKVLFIARRLRRNFLEAKVLCSPVFPLRIERRRESTGVTKYNNSSRI